MKGLQANNAVAHNRNSQFILFKLFTGDTQIITFDNQQIDLNHSSILFLIENLLFFGDINSENQILFIDNHLNDSDNNYNNDFVEHRMRQQHEHDDEINRTIDAHKSTWISYDPRQSSKTDDINSDHTISSIERI